MIPQLVALLWIAPLAPAQSLGCIEVERDRIVAGDLAASLSSFAQLPPQTPLGASPLPGVRRFFHLPELKMLAKRYGMDIGAAPDVCVERPMEKLDREKVLESMRQALGLKDARIEIAETNLYPVPRGRVMFRREDLGRPALASSESPVIWRGNVLYGDSHRFAIWARVHVSASVPRVVAVEDLKRGEPIATSKVRVETATAFPAAGDVARTIEEVAGRTPVRDVAAGSEIHLGQTVQTPDVSRGEMIDVEVQSGAARLRFTGKAETAGVSGDIVTVRNPATNKVFQARVLGRGKAFLDAGRANGR
jgi:flagella basal body P-ring formation protein FlgA